MAFPFAAVGAGLGQAADFAQKQQDANIRQQMLQTHLYNMRRQQEQESIAAQAALLGANFDLGGGGGGYGTLPGATKVPTAPSPYTQTPAGSGMSSGLSDPRSLVRQHESGGNYNVGYGGADLSSAPLDQYGFPQWAGKQGPAGISHAAGAYQFQPATWRRYGEPLGVRDFSPESQDKVFDAAFAKEGYSPWAPYNPRLAQAISGQGGGQQPQQQMAQAAPAPTAGITPPPSPPPSPQFILNQLKQQNPGVDPRALMKALPDILKRKHDEYKDAFEQWKGTAQVTGEAETRGETAWFHRDTSERDRQRLVGEAESRAQTAKRDTSTAEYQAGLLRPKQEEEAARGAQWQSVLGEQFPEAAKQAGQIGQQLDKTIDPTVRQRMSIQALAQQVEKANPGAPDSVKMMALESRVKMLAPEEQAKMRAELEVFKSQLRASANRRNVTVTDAGGKVLFQGSASPSVGTEGGWISSATNKPIEVPEGAELRISGTGEPGRQQAAQMARLRGAANEASGMLRNLSEMNHAATLGWFQGVQQLQGKTLLEGIRHSLANEISEEDAQMMGVTVDMLGPTLARVGTVGAATGLKAIGDSLKNLAPAKGDTVITTMQKLAEIRQIVERGVENALAEKDIPRDTRVLLEKIDGEVKESVPWTVLDVIKLRRSPGEQSFREVAGKMGLFKDGGGRRGQVGGAAPAAPAAAGPYSVGQIIDVPGKGKFRVTGGDLTKDPDVEPVK